MSLIIKGMNMPSKCRFCPCCADNGLIGMQREYFCSAVDSALEIDNLDQKLSACPLVEIPITHGRLIDADKLRKRLDLAYCEKCEQHNCTVCGVNDSLVFIDTFPTIIEAEVSE